MTESTAVVLRSLSNVANVLFSKETTPCVSVFSTSSGTEGSNSFFTRESVSFSTPINVLFNNKFTLLVKFNNGPPGVPANSSSTSVSKPLTAEFEPSRPFMVVFILPSTPFIAADKVLFNTVSSSLVTFCSNGVTTVLIRL